MCPGRRSCFSPESFVRRSGNCRKSKECWGVLPGVVSDVELSFQLTPHMAKLISIEQDEYGIIPGHLRRTLQEYHHRWQADPSTKFPKLMYVNPTGQNPNGTTMPLERKKEVYRIASEYNILILEDDPYFFLHFLDHAPDSFLSLDTDGRVLRFDSFSKILSGGLRIGWVTGPKDLIHPIELHIQSSYLHANTLSQVRIIIYLFEDNVKV